MSYCSPMMNSSTAGYCGGCFAARMTSALLLAAGIALAMSVVFFSAAVLGVRLCIISLIILAVVIVPLVLIRRPFQRRKR